MTPVLVETPRLLALAKPAGMTVIPARGEAPEACVWHQLEAERGERLWVVHRLDRDTSGVLLFARDAEAHRGLSMAFEAGKVLKTYLAFVRGCPEPPEGSVELALHSARKGKMRPALPGEPGALPSRTDYRVLRRWRHPASCLALVEARPRSGRSHQIRVHLRAIGCPILGDPIYGGSGVEGLPPPPRMALHAACLELPPLPGIPALVVEAPLPADLDAFTRALEEGFPLA